jgi:hypothetical protein
MNVPKTSLPILYPGSCEPLKAACHGLALGLAVLMGAYNAAAWIRRRLSHLAINATIYIVAAFWEQRHVAHHLFPCLPSSGVPSALQGNAAEQDEPSPAKAA